MEISYKQSVRDRDLFKKLAEKYSESKDELDIKTNYRTIYRVWGSLTKYIQKQISEDGKSLELLNLIKIGKQSGETVFVPSKDFLKLGRFKYRLREDCHNLADYDSF